MMPNYDCSGLGCGHQPCICDGAHPLGREPVRMNDQSHTTEGVRPPEEHEDRSFHWLAIGSVHNAVEWNGTSWEFTGQYDPEYPVDLALRGWRYAGPIYYPNEGSNT